MRALKSEKRTKLQNLKKGMVINMKTPRIAEAVGNIDGELVSGAIEYGKIRKKRRFLQIGSIAACLVAVIVAAAIIIPMLDGGITVVIGGIERDYKSTVSGSESNIEFPWEYKLVYEKFDTVEYNGMKYTSRRRGIDISLLDSVIGECTAEGFDFYSDKTYTETFSVRKIRGVSENRLIAVGRDSDYYVYFVDKIKCPETLGELIDEYNLCETLALNEFSVNEGYSEKGYYRINEDDYIWKILLECKNAELCVETDAWNRGNKNYLSFTATSEALGVYKRVFYVTEDGYVSTNVFDYSHVYYIGKEASDKIISYAKDNSSKAASTQYEYTIAGTVTEIGDGYVLIDDSVLCRNEDDGIVFKVLTEDMIIRRYVEFMGVKVGDTVAVKFQSEIVLGEDNSVRGAVSMYKGIVVDGGVAVPE